MKIDTRKNGAGPCPLWDTIKSSVLTSSRLTSSPHFSTVSATTNTTATTTTAATTTVNAAATTLSFLCAHALVSCTSVWNTLPYKAGSSYTLILCITFSSPLQAILLTLSVCVCV